MTPDELAEWVNSMSDVLCGCREGSEAQMLGRAKELVVLEKAANLVKHRKNVIKALNNLEEALDDAAFDLEYPGHPPTLAPASACR